ncbi:MAG: hypothetical protein ACFFD1_09980 [Candidatus Thorarchaeota archaeon]
MNFFHNSFNLGYRLGSLSRNLEIVIETANAKTAKERYQIEAYRIHENLKYVHDELSELNILDQIQTEIENYLTELTGFYKEELPESQKQGMFLSKVKRKLTDHKLRPNRTLKQHEVAELDLKLKMWKDRITNELIKMN